MSALSKSHKMKKITDYKVIKQRKGVTSIIPKNINKFSKKYDETVFELELGDLLIFDGNLIHKSNFNKTKKARIVGIHRSAIFSK
jgi:ectoine hydroxylase-related dioxygenase (phytanoyl-CoA dioxygenase family)